ncbi:MAG: hypothetical protein ACRDON_13355, partial [Gaiellaceae bacterium]
MKRLLVLLAAGLAATVIVVPMGGATDKVTLCHATHSETNPYVVITVAASAAWHGHLAEGNGGGAPHQEAEDIVPPFEWQGQVYSQNWDAEGIAIWENDCEVGGGDDGGTTGGDD